MAHYAPQRGGGGRDDDRRWDDRDRRGPPRERYDDRDRRGGGGGGRGDHNDRGRGSDRDRGYERERHNDNRRPQNRGGDNRGGYGGNGGGGGGDDRGNYRNGGRGYVDNMRGDHDGYRGGDRGGRGDRRYDDRDRDRGGHDGGSGGGDRRFDRNNGGDMGHQDRSGYGRDDRGHGGGGSGRGGYERDDRDRGGYAGRGGERNGGGGGRYDRRGPPGRGGGGVNSHGDRGRGGGGGRGPQRTRTTINMSATEASANIICANVTNNFRFHHYGIDGSTAKGGSIDSRRRKAELFHFGIFDPEHGLLARNKMSPKEIEDFRRVTFFEGSFCYTSRKIPFVTQTPFSLVGKKVPESGAPSSDNGDIMTIMSYQCFHVPEQLMHENHVKSSADGIVVDLRCADSTQAFKTKDALLAHCKQTGHSPMTDLDGDSKCSTTEQFIGYCNVALQRAMGERMARWGREYIDPKNWTEPTDRNGRSMGVRIFRAFACEFGIHRIADGKNSLSLTVDLRAKLIRTKSLIDNLCHDQNPDTMQFDGRDKTEAKRRYQGEVVICTYDKKCYSVIDLDFDKSPATLPVQGTGMSHAQYFKERKGIDLKYPNAAPIVVVLGRNNKPIFLPAELVCANELDPMVKQKLPMIASFTPPERHDAIEEIRKYLVPGAQKTKGVGGGLLPALGIVVEDARVKVPVEVLPLPLLLAAGLTIPKEKANMWAPVISRADYKVAENKAVEMKVVLIHHDSLKNDVQPIYEKIRDLVNKHNSHYRFSSRPHHSISARNDNEHCDAVSRYFQQKLPDNVFVLDLVKPPRRQALDTAYNVVKYLLTKNGYLSQFLNFNTHDHARARDQKAVRKSTTILQGLARQILSKCGARIWWVSLPREVRLPAVFVGVDVFHSPRKYSVVEGRKVSKPSVAAVIVQIVRSHEESENTHTEIFSQTFQRERGNEMGLGESIETTVSNALRIFDVNPMSCVMWRDGVGDPAIKQVAKEEIPALRTALHRGNPDANVPLSYLVVQKRIATKFLSVDGKSALPLGSLVTSLQGPEHSTFYINGTAPPYSTPKPARFVIAQKDEALALTDRNIADLSWALCHDYSNWTGAIKLPSPVQMAHKLAELAGLMDKGGDDIDAEKFAGKAHFL